MVILWAKRRDACALSFSSFSTTCLSSSMEPAILRHVPFFSAGLFSRYSRKSVSSRPSTNQYLRLSSSLPHGWTDSGTFKSSACLFCLYASLMMALITSDSWRDHMTSARIRSSCLEVSRSPTSAAAFTYSFCWLHAIECATASKWIDVIPCNRPLTLVALKCLLKCSPVMSVPVITRDH